MQSLITAPVKTRQSFFGVVVVGTASAWSSMAKTTTITG
jgi:hypothetical protein